MNFAVKSHSRASELAQQMAPAAKPDDLRSVLGIPMIEEELTPASCPLSLCSHCATVYLCIHMQNKYILEM